MEDRETARMSKYGESKTTRIMMATVPHVTSGLGIRKFQADGFLLDTSVNFVLHFCSDTVNFKHYSHFGQRTDASIYRIISVL